MARILSIDYGLKRTGIAVTDTLQIIANGLETVDSNSLISFLKNYCKMEPVDEIIIGYPVGLRLENTDVTELVDNIVIQLTNEFPSIPITKVDERFSSKMAFQAMIDGGLKKKDRQNKATIDKISAVILLQNYLEQKRYTKC